MNAAGQCPSCEGFLLVPIEQLTEEMVAWECHHCATLFATEINNETRIGWLDSDSGDT